MYLLRLLRDGLLVPSLRILRTILLQVLLTRAHTHTRGTGLHTRHPLPPSTRDDDDATTTAPCPRLVLTHPHM